MSSKLWSTSKICDPNGSDEN